jgi:Acyl-CoA thioesterase C-terminal domain/Acyl-CoA thioesterase N-terminal domain
VTDAFFRADGDLYVPTERTRGPWDPDSQHAGPPAGLIGREVERLEGGEDRHVARITFEILRPVPIAPLSVEAEVVRGGRSVELVEASLSDAEGAVMKARAWRLRSATVELPAGLGSADGPGSTGRSSSTLRPGFAPDGPAEASAGDFPETGREVGYHTAMEYRFLSGGFTEPGPAVVWMRMRHPLLDGEDPSPLQRVLVAADSGNGVSAALDWNRYLFINVELTVHLHRALIGEWVCLDAITIPERDGVGIADTALYDERGPIGRAMQALLVDERGER